MKTKLLFAAILAIGFVNVGCTKQKYEANRRAAEEWLATTAGRASVDISGSWEASEMGWGGIRFVQSGNKITGAMGNYIVNGYVNGSKVSLALSSNGWVYYTVVMRKTGNRLSGFYSSSVPFSPDDQSAVNLVRIGN